MNLSQSWQRRLKVREPELVVLALISPTGIDPTLPIEDFALQPGTVRIAQERADIAADGVTLPFAPYLAEWPAIEERYAPQDRRLEISETTLKVTGGARLADVFRQVGSGQLATCQVALWSPRMALSEALLRLAGPVRGVPDAPELGGPVDITVTDGDPDRVVEFPPGPITMAEFGAGVPDHVAGVAQRTWISSSAGSSGGYPLQTPCHQIDEDGLLHYVHEGEFSGAPTDFWNYGSALAAKPRVEVRAMLASGLPYTCLVFDEPPPTPPGLVPMVTCGGGRGVVESSPPLFLLETIGGYRVTPRARQALEQSPFLFDAMANVRGDVRRIVAEQLIPQTDMVMSFRHGMVDILPLSAMRSERRLGIGYGLLYRHAKQDRETPLASVYNAFKIYCGRNASARNGSLTEVRRDVDQGSDEIRSILARSQRAYGRRAYPGGWEAFDLAVVEGPDGSLTCPSGELLGDVLARAHAFPWQPHRYRASWVEGLGLDVGQTAYITDADEGLADAEVVVTSILPLATGVDVTFAAQALPARKTATQRKVFANA